MTQPQSSTQLLQKHLFFAKNTPKIQWILEKQKPLWAFPNSFSYLFGIIFAHIDQFLIN